MRSIRERLIEAIDDNGGYDKFALAYDVGLDRCDFRPAALEKIIKRDYDPDFEFFSYYDDQRMYDLVYRQAEEDVRSTLDKDKGDYLEYPLDVMIRHGLPTDKRDCSFNAAYGLYGRGGRHLCVEEFDGKKLPGNLADILREPEDCCRRGFTNWWCRRLLAAMETWDEEFTQKRVAEIAQDFAAWELYEFNCLNIREAQRVALMP